MRLVNICETGKFWLLPYQLSYSNLFVGQLNLYSAQKQIAYKSWWPTHATWNSASNGCHTGYWSKANEDWFPQWRHSILNSKAQPLSSSKWRDLLKGIKTSHHLKLNVRVVLTIILIPPFLHRFHVSSTFTCATSFTFTGMSNQTIFSQTLASVALKSTSLIPTV